ncbi:hypothetical protein [Lysobacter gummosus]
MMFFRSSRYPRRRSQASRRVLKGTRRFPCDLLGKRRCAAIVKAALP